MSRGALPLIALAAAYFAAARLGLALAQVHPSATAVWPPAGIALAAVLLAGWRVLPAIFAGALAANVSVSGSWASAPLIAAGNTAEAALGAWLLSRWARGARAFDAPGDVFRFAIGAAPLAAALGATAGTGALALTGELQGAGGGPVWLTWWLGDLGGMLLAAPPLLLWLAPSRERREAPRSVETALVLAATAAVTLSVFGGITGRQPVSSLLLPPLIWSAIRLGARATSPLLVLLYLIAAWGTLNGDGPFAAAGPHAALLLLQSFMIVASITALAASAASEESRRAERALRGLRDELERQVQERTAELARSVEALRAQSEERELANRTMRLYGDMIERAQIGLAVFRQEESGLRLRAANPVADRLLGSGLGMDLKGACARAVESGAPQELGQISAKDGRQFQVRALPLDRDLIGVVFEDVTGRRQEQEAELAGKRESMQRDFVAAVSHAFRTPLAIIMGCAESLQLWGMNDAQEQPRLVKTIEKNADRLVRLVEDMLKLSALQAGKAPRAPEPIPVRDFVHLVADRVARAAERKRVSFKIEVPSELKVVADRGQLEEVLQSLCQNALECSPPDSEVDVRGSTLEGHALITVADRGLAIPPAELGRVFDCFHRGARTRALKQSATGLALPIVKSLVENSGGRVWAESDGARGASFRFTLPLAR